MLNNLILILLEGKHFPIIFFLYKSVTKRDPKKIIANAEYIEIL